MIAVAACSDSNQSASMANELLADQGGSYIKTAFLACDNNKPPTCQPVPSETGNGYGFDCQCGNGEPGADCKDSNECSPDAFCVNHKTCAARFPKGYSCSEYFHCQSNVCLDGECT